MPASPHIGVESWDPAPDETHRVFHNFLCYVHVRGVYIIIIWRIHVPTWPIGIGVYGSVWTISYMLLRRRHRASFVVNVLRLRCRKYNAYVSIAGDVEISVLRCRCGIGTGSSTTPGLCSFLSSAHYRR